MSSNAYINVLLVEDCQTDILYFEALLAQIPNQEYRVVSARSIHDAARSLSVGFMPDVIFLDLCLPDSLGLDTISRMAEIAPDTPIIVLTSTKNIHTEHQAAQIGVQEFLVKGESDSRDLEKTIFYAIERKNTERSLFELSNLDALTRLFNRACFNEYLKKSIARVKRTESMLGLLFLDLDRFKNINDTLGHDMGDQLLCEISSRLSATLREGDIIARFGGDEFTIILEGIDNHACAELVANKVIKALSAPIKLEGHQIVITTSIGIAMFPDAGMDAVALTKNADAAMYQAKDQGGNGYCVYCDRMNLKLLSRLNLEEDLRAAIEREEFVLHYQSVLDVETEEVLAVEALLRWDHPDREGLIPPDEFIPILEETGLIVEVGDWVLKTACKQCKAWHDSGLPDLRIAVNVSPQQLRTRSDVDWIAQALKESDLDAQYLDLEITEGVLLGDSETVADQLGKIQAMGVGLSIDDFGTGYSSLSYLKKYKLNVLKIDRSFLCDVATDHQSAVLVTAIITMAHGLGLRVIAEGVEDQAQLEFLRAEHCDEVQGYYFCRPITAQDFIQSMSVVELCV